MKKRPGIDAPMVCSIVLQGYSCNVKDPRLEWSINLPPPPPRSTRSAPGKIRTRKMSRSGRSRNYRSGANHYKVLHLTDIHWDPEYKEGSPSKCPDPLCCRPDSGGSDSAVAGLWGDYGPCDIPWRTVEATLEHVSTEHADAEWVVMTGDLTPHAIWTSSQQENSMIVNRLNHAIQKSFPNTPVYPTLGNHEAHPLNRLRIAELSARAGPGRLFYLKTGLARISN
ncbi:hypothetical protein J437_LFUL019217 [Ladona fulva]|uniref:Calcineurin-like phosphoesterase domain-containing protein n=1 Tax=Ladona fulva TaxID=123851 RepID=A0A8K0PA05_LADFU|nr:hypothetical protein J437_LFUL019217 [Ladona fulva]